jgi:hypothetical protein
MWRQLPQLPPKKASFGSLFHFRLRQRDYASPVICRDAQNRFSLCKTKGSPSTPTANDALPALAAARTRIPPIDQTWGERDPIPGLLAAGNTLDAARLRTAYSQGIFPWFSEGQPVLWWSPTRAWPCIPTSFACTAACAKTAEISQRSAL